MKAAAQRPSWRALAASIAVTAVVASGSTWMVSIGINRMRR